MNSAEKPGITRILRPISRQKNLSDAANNYLQYYGESKLGDDDKPKAADCQEVTVAYYDIATDFFEYGWGEGFHFATINKGESREHAFARHEYKLALKLGLKKGATVLVGGRLVYSGVVMTNTNAKSPPRYTIIIAVNNNNNNNNSFFLLVWTLMCVVDGV